jgi:hypothetical protein
MRSQGVDCNYNEDVFRFQIGTIPSADIEYNSVTKQTTYTGNQYSSNSVVCLRQHGTKFQGNGDPDSVNFPNHAINKFYNKLYDATCGKGGYDCDYFGIMQYLQENCYITILEPNGTEHTLFTGSQMNPGLIAIGQGE